MGMIATNARMGFSGRGAEVATEIIYWNGDFGWYEVMNDE